MSCSNCGYSNSSYDGVCFFCHRGHSKELSQFGHSLLMALGKHAPTKKKEEKKEEVKEKKKLWIADIKDTGYTNVRSLYSTVTETNEFDDVSKKEIFDKLTIALVVIRGEAFKIEKPFGYSVQDCTSIRTLLQAYKPAQIAKAIINAARDPFWKTKGVSFLQLQTNIHKLLLNNHSQSGDATKERRAQVMNEINEKIELLRYRNPITAIEYEEMNRSMMDIGSLELMNNKLKEELN